MIFSSYISLLEVFRVVRNNPENAINLDLFMSKYHVKRL